MGGDCDDTKFDDTSEMDKDKGMLGTSYKCPICGVKLDVPSAFKD